MDHSFAVDLLGALEEHLGVVADLLGNGGQPLVILAGVGAVSVEAQLGLVDLGGDHGDVHQKQDLFQRRLLDVEGRTALEGHHFLALLRLDALELGLGELDADVDGVEGQHVGLEDQEIRGFYVGHDGRVVQLDADVILLRGVLNEILNFRGRPLGLHQFPAVIFEDVGALKRLQDLLKTVLLPLSQRVIELHPVSLILLILRHYLKVVLLVYLPEELADVVLNLPLLGAQDLLLALPSVLLLVVLDHEGLVLHLCDPELREALLVGLYVVQDRAAFYLEEDGVLVEEVGLF